jgi:hypothetical protein
MDPLCGAPDDARWLAFCRAFTPWALARGARTSLTQARPVDAQALRAGAAAPCAARQCAGLGLRAPCTVSPHPALATELLVRAVDAPPCCRRAVITRSAHAALHSVGHYVGYEGVGASSAGSTAPRARRGRGRARMRAPLRRARRPRSSRAGSTAWTADTPARASRRPTLRSS